MEFGKRERKKLEMEENKIKDGDRNGLMKGGKKEENKNDRGIRDKEGDMIKRIKEKYRSDI